MASVVYLNYEQVNPLSSIEITVLTKEEFLLAKNVLEKHSNPSEFLEIYQQSVAFSAPYQVLAAAETFACSTAICESIFSFLTQISNHRVFQGLVNI